MRNLMLLTIFVAAAFVNADITGLDIKYVADTTTLTRESAFSYQAPLNAYQYRAENQTVADYGTFDYIVVGAGSAGAVLATRLSEREDLKILLIEAGEKTSTANNIPGLYVYQQLSNYTWHFKSVPQETCCLGMINHQCLHPRGRGLGGTSLINGLVYSRGNKHDYDSWARSGNWGWSYNDVLPYFIKSENSQIEGDPGYHGKGGVLNVEYREPPTPWFDALIGASQLIGLQITDYNGREEIGVARAQHTFINGRRDDTGTAFIFRSQYRANLKVLTHGYVKKVAIDGRKQAQGVLFDYNGQTYRATAKKEVILSAGAFGSPHLLIQSGIGPAKLLNSLNIPLVADLPVGENYQDHASFWGLFVTTNYSTPETSVYENARDYLEYNFGPLTFAGGEGAAFLRTPSSKTPKGVPNVEFLMEPAHALDIERLAFNFDNVTYDTIMGQVNPRAFCRIIVTLLKPVSRGTVQSTSSNPYDFPAVNPKFLSDKGNEDIQAIYEGIQIVRDMVKTEPFRKIGGQVLPNVLPQCEDYAADSQEQWYCQIRHLTAHLYHPVGTCKMAPSARNGGVVNNELKVHGIKKLRVADASIMPDIVAGHTNAPTIMIAEKLAEQIKRTWW